MPSAHSSAGAPTRQRLPLGALVLLSVACFTAVATETLPVGLLPLMAVDLGVSESAVGLLVSVYAGTVVVASVPLNAWTSRWPRRPLMAGLVAAYAVSNLVLCLTDLYVVAAAARVIGGLTHALFFAVLFGYAAALAPPARIGAALAVAGAGSSVAVAVGTPLGTVLGGVVGWRGSFAVAAVLSAVVAALLWWRLPPLPGSDVGGGRQLREVLRQPTFRWLEVGTLLVVTGVFASYTYLSPIMIDFGFRAGTVGGVLLVWGVAALVGLVLLGRLADTHLRPTLVGVTAALALLLAVLAVLPRHPVAGTGLLVLWGLAAGPVNPLLQTAITRAAAAHASTAAAVHNAVFNLGIATGAFLGAEVLRAHPAPSTGVVSAVCLAAGAVLFWRWLRPEPAEDVR